MGGTGCYCRITDDLIDSISAPSTLNTFCMNDVGYTQCPTWRADKEHAWAERTNRPLLGEDGQLRVPDELDIDRARMARVKAEREEAEASG